uniref:Uncharacterized protein n=1 Tax=Parascaris equorum TaxID=6256 RepID=A0A914S4K5_PAREQ
MIDKKLKMASIIDAFLMQVMKQHYEAACQLQASGVQYQMRINIKKQEHVEAVELHYLAYAYLFKWLLADVDWTREQLLQMLTFAETFSYHGVCRRNTGHDLFAVAPEIRSCVAELIYRTHIAHMDGVARCMEKMLERI